MARLLPKTLDRWPKHGVWLPVCLLLGYALVLASCSIADFPDTMHEGTWMPFLSVRPVGDDGFYYLSVAWNVASGRGLTVDGTTSTTGIQPLVPLLWALPAKIVQWCGGTKWHLVRFVILFGASNLVLFAFVAARCAETICTFVSERESYAVFLLTIGNYPLFRLFTYGLETGVYLTLLATGTMVALELERSETVSTLGAGLLFGVTGLVRLDFGVALACFYVASLIAGSLSLRRVLESGSVALLIVSPWLAWVYVHLGTIVPSSGIAESGFILHHAHAPYRLGVGVEVLLEHFLPFLHVRSNDLWTYLSLPIAGVVAYGARRRWPDETSNLFEGHAWHWGIAFGSFVVVYVLGFRSTWFYVRYLSPLYLLFVPYVAGALLELGNERLGLRHPVWARIAMGLVCLQCAGWLVFHLHLGDYAPSDKSVAAGEIRTRFAPEDVTVGAFQTGVISYFNKSVVNLDGKVNNDVLPYLHDDRICEYMRRAELDVLIDSPVVLEGHVSDSCLETAWRPCERPFPGPFVCYRRPTD